MYCSIQEVERKTASKGFMMSLKVKVDESDVFEEYLYDVVKEPYKRPIKTAYKITINQCFRENKKVKKNQYTIGTVGYYDFLQNHYWEKLDKRCYELSQRISQSYEEIVHLVWEKIGPLQNKIRQAFTQTEEHKCYAECEETIKKHKDAKFKFEQKYKCKCFENCYDVFLNVQNRELLDIFEEDYENKKLENKNTEISCEDCAYTTFQRRNYSNQDIRILQNMYAFLVEKFHPLQNNNSPEYIRAMEILQDVKALIEKATSTN